jgi:hypothetical protein
MTAAIWHLEEYNTGAIQNRAQLFTAIRAAFLLAGWTLHQDIYTLSGEPTLELSRVLSSATKGTIYMRVTQLNSNFGGHFEVRMSTQPTFGVNTTNDRYNTFFLPWQNNDAEIAQSNWKIMSCIHPEAGMIHIYRNVPSGLFSWCGWMRPIQKPSFFNEDLFPYAMLWATQGLSVTPRMWGRHPQDNPYSNADPSLYPLWSNNYQFTNEETFNYATNLRELYPSLIFRHPRGWYGTTSADIVKGQYQFPGDKYITPQGAEYLPCALPSGMSIRI